MLRKIILSVLGVALIIGAFIFANYLIDNKHKPKPVIPKVVKTVLVDTVKNTTIPIVIAANGNLTALQRVELYSEVQGLFKTGSKLFKPGQKFNRGETLIRIDASEYYASVQSAKSDLYNSIAAIMPDLRLDFPEVFQKWQTYLNGFDLNKTTPKLPEISGEKENYFITGRGIVSAFYNVKNLEQRLTKYRIIAPFSGILTEALVTEGTLVRNGQKLGEFINPSIYEMEVAVSKSFADVLKVGESVTLTSLDNTKTYEGKVSRVNGSIDATTQTITAYIAVEHSDLKEGMYLEANLNAEKVENAIEIDRNLLLDTQEIYVIKDSLLDVIAVRPAHFSNTSVVLRDVPNGTIILRKPVPGAYAGMHVKAASNSDKTSDSIQ
ncbi:Membrane fusion protein of RND family multidrug efflux pump [Winogradskyella psychrotolerans RS-3]|uniref:Membrane fusion protein of RND family multidrug efflux pump n=1 Tax=Winogradskyella psychrotolerans RS-3 TaxID=641526 RepID=S7VT83_9FLAO|nr:HlyD family efflux transporter periplasmic adaptor subunit [Winogradskyella psychrotolerans]EPR72572.1 Membrane fusion protein of RND family multidrug efflux pump [Winogradskyella psychrotolerans RS-3]